MKARRVITPRDKELLSNLAQHIKAMFRTEDIPFNAISVLSAIGDKTRYKMGVGKPVTTTSILRAADALGYELVFVKRKDAKSVYDDPDMMLKLKEFREKSNNQSRKRRGKTKPTGPKVRIKRPSESTTGYIAIQSRREQLDNAQAQDDFFGAP